MADAVAVPADTEVVDARDEEQTEGSKRALLYLRVSTKEQAMRSGDPEGYSLPTQREACLRKAQSLGADVVQEYLDKDTGTLVDKRPAMQELLARVAADRNIDYVIVHKLDRLARNRLDDAHMTVTLEAAGATLVSCVEGIDQSPSGRLLHGMLASVNEYYSRNLSDEIKRKTIQKAKNGGTPFLAPIGYLNKQDLSGGRDDRWVELDPGRAPLIAWAFEAYATGEWSLNSLLVELTARGLMTRPTTKRPAKELHLSMLERILIRPYYMGIVTWRGVQYQGTHTPLITPDVFFKVQEVLAAHYSGGERSWRHQHHLKGSVFCGDCESRLTLDFASGNGGRYSYFVCLGRKRKVVCNQKAMQTEAVEQALERHWRTVRIPDDRKAEIRRLLAEDLTAERAEAATDCLVQERRIQRLKDERQKVLDGYYAGAIPLDLLKTEQTRIGRGLAQAEQRLSKLSGQFDQIESVITRAIAWVDSLHEAYLAATEHVRRLLNQALYKQVFVDLNGVVRVIYTEGFDWLMGEEPDQDQEGQEATAEGQSDVRVEAEVVVRFERRARHNDQRPGRRAGAHARGFLDHGWNVKHLVGRIAVLSNLLAGHDTRRVIETLRRHLSDHGTRGAKPPRAQGPARRQAQKRLDDAGQAQVVDDYLEGLNVYEIAELRGVHRQTVSAILRRRGVGMRRQGLGEARIADAADLYRDGLSTLAIGRKFGVSDQTVGQALRSLGVQLRPRRGGRAARQ